MWYTQGELGRARTGLNRALALAHGAGDLQVVAHAENLSGHIEHAEGNDHVARDRFTLSIERYRALAIPWGTGNALNGMAGVALATGDVDQAERLLEEATSVLRHAGPWFLTSALLVRAILCGAAQERGRSDRAGA